MACHVEVFTASLIENLRMGLGVQVVHGISIDIEDWYQSSFGPNAPLTDRFEASTDKILSALAETGTKPTSLVLGLAGGRLPHPIKRMAGEGDEIQSHGYARFINSALTRDALRENLLRAKRLTEDLCGQEVYGYRAPYLNVDREPHRT